MDILVVGTGYVGLVTGTCLAEMGHRVICLDINQDKIDDLNAGIIPIYEPGLDEMLNRNRLSNRLFFTTDYEKGVHQSTVCFITVDTPISADGSANLAQVEAAVLSIAKHMNEDKILVIKSTVPVGTTLRLKHLIKNYLEKEKNQFSVEVVSNPEFLKEGNALQDCLKPDRIILGLDSENALETMKEIYAPFMINHERLLIMDSASAEITKYAANMMLATRISVMNEIAEFCEKTGANIEKVRKGIGSDHRIGYNFLYAGVGFGGSCLPKDLRAFRNHASQLGVQTEILDAVEQVNLKQKRKMASKIRHYFEEKGEFGEKTCAILGLSFKPDTDDLREAPALVLIEELLKNKISCRVYDPVAMPKAKLLLHSDKIYFAKSEEDAAFKADALVLMTEWKQFRFLDFAKIIPLMKGRAFFDGRNQYSGEKMAQMGFDYISIGKEALKMCCNL